MEKSPAPISTKEMSLKRKTSIEVNNKPEHEKKAEEVTTGKPNKNIIKLSDLMTNMDPLEYFSRFLTIPDMIFRHFKGKDLIAASEVSPDWYNFIASSKVLMKDIKVVFDDKRVLGTLFKHLNAEDLIEISPHQNDCSIIMSSKFLMKFNKIHLEDHSLLKNSSRLYQNIEIKRTSVEAEDENLRKFDDDQFMTSSELDFFHSKAHEWKNVSLRNVYFRKKLDLWRFLSVIESSVESICVEDFGFLPFEDQSAENESFEALKFPKLKRLKMFHRCSDNSFSDTLAGFLLNSVEIEELSLRDMSGKISEDFLTKMLGNFDKLTNLQLDSLILDQLFEDESWKQFQVKLKGLIIGIFIETDFFNFRNFLKSQSDYLENLTFPGIDIDRETFDVIMKMPKLKNLDLIYSNGYTQYINIISTSITELTLLTITSENLKFLLDSMPKVTNLTLIVMDEENFKMLKSMKRKFEKLKVHELKGVNRKEMEEIMTENYLSLEIIKII